MRKKENKPEYVYRIFDRESKYFEKVYSRAYGIESDFRTVDEARSSHCWGIYKDEGKYRIAKYKVTYELIDEDCKQ